MWSTIFCLSILCLLGPQMKDKCGGFGQDVREVLFVCFLVQKFYD